MITPTPETSPTLKTGECYLLWEPLLDKSDLYAFKVVVGNIITSENIIAEADAWRIHFDYDVFENPVYWQGQKINTKLWFSLYKSKKYHLTGDIRVPSASKWEHWWYSRLAAPFEEGLQEAMESFKSLRRNS